MKENVYVVIIRLPVADVVRVVKKEKLNEVLKKLKKATKAPINLYECEVES